MPTETLSTENPKLRSLRAERPSLDLPVPAAGRETGEFSSARAPFSGQVIPEIVTAQARRHADRIAVVCGDEKLSYRDLNARANQLAHRLQKLGVGPETLVAIYQERSAATVVAILAILKAGGAYLPIDLAYPTERVRFMLEDAKAPVLITEKKHAGTLPEYSGRVICLDSDWPEIGSESTLDPVAAITPESAAYVIYTSGSTGKPKGVIVTHRNVVRLFGATDHWFGFSEHDVWTLFHSFAFDFSVWELWGALFYGGKVVVVPYLISRSPSAFHELLVAERVTVLNQTPSAFRQLIWAEQNAAEKKLLSLRYVIFGGEALELQSLRPWFERHGDQTPRLINMYGITETTVHVTYRPITRADVETGMGSVIGGPIPDLTLHVLDENRQPVPVGATGEMYIGGAGVARGYLNRPELTGEKFIPDPFHRETGGRLYRSGDLARILPGGDLEYLGRMDHQVKIRGFRIELGEIETGLNSHPSIRESAVIAQEQTEGDKRLVAYLVHRGTPPSIDELRAFLGKALPAYMVPAVYVFLEALPLTVNGKVDRRALPSPEGIRPALKKEFVEASTREEKILAGIWQDALQIDRVGVHDNFFELGGDSIRSIQVLARAQEKGLHFSLQKLFEHPTVFELVRMLDSRGTESIASRRPPFALVPEADRSKLPSGLEDAYPMVKLQVGMVFHSDYDPKSAIFHDVFSFRLTLPFEESKLRQAIRQLVARHPIFRTSFDLAGFSEPLQLLHREAETPFSVEDLRALSAEAQKAKLVEWVEVEKRRRFDWSVAPLMRLHVQRYPENTFQFIVSFHHVIMDGWSLAAMLTELFQDYAALIEGRTAGISTPRVTYRDFVELEEEAIRSGEVRDYWTRKLENPTLHSLPRWPKEMRQGGREQVRGPEIIIGDDTFARLKRLANELGVPTRTVLLTAHCRVMGALTGQSDILTGLVANGRPQALDGEKLIGLFLNTLPFRVQMNGGTWKELIQQTFVTERELIPHRRAPLSTIQQWTGGQALFETTFDFVQFHVYRDLPGYKDHSFLEDHYFEANNFTFFTTFMLDAAAAQLQMHFDYDPNELCEEQIRSMCDYYINTLAAMAAEPEARYELHSPVSPAERRRLVSEWNDTRQEYPLAAVHQLIERQVKKTPGAVAVSFGGQGLTYDQLNQRADFLAAHLRAKQVSRGSRIGIHCERSLEMLIAVLAVWKAGAAYVPLDPAYPAERIEFMSDDAELALILTQERNRHRLSARTPSLPIEEVLAGFSTDSEISIPAASRTASNPEDVAYMIYTSGSTGKPKGVQIPHRAVANFLESMRRTPGLTDRDTLLAVTTLSFDIAGLELFLPLTVGGRVVIASTETILDPAALAEAMETNVVTVMQATPTTWRALVESGWAGRAGLKVLCGGEALSRELAKALLERVGEVWNMYGPTETTIWSSIEKVRPGVETVPIGRPIANTEFYLLDAQLNPVPIGALGEIYIGGDGLARGYFKRPELTEERFIAHPFKPGARLYRTGDVGRYLPDGRIVCAGRVDHQVKLRGFRIELGEIESALLRHPAVSAAVVVAGDDGAGGQRLVAYWILRENQSVSVRDLRSLLETTLPGYMIPSVFMELPQFPLTPNGKVDRKRLPKAGDSRPELEREFVEPRTPLEEILTATWKDVLKLNRVGVRDNFFDLGGHSLSAMQVIARLRNQFETELTIASFFAHPTIESFTLVLTGEMLVESGLSAEEVETILGEAAVPSPVIVRSPVVSRATANPIS